MAPAVKNGKVVTGTAAAPAATPAPSTGGTAAAAGTAARGTSGGTKRAAPVEAEPLPTEPEIDAASISPTQDQLMTDFARQKLQEQRTGQAPTPSMTQRVAETAVKSVAPVSGMFPSAVAAPATYAAYKLYESGPEMARALKSKVVGGLTRAAQEYGPESGLRRVAQLAYEYLPGELPEVQTESPRPGSRGAQAGPIIYAPQQARAPSARDLSSVAEFRKFYETELGNLAEIRGKLGKIDEEIKTAPASFASDEYQALAKMRGALKQQETDARATLMRSGLAPTEIDALLQGQVPQRQQ